MIIFNKIQNGIKKATPNLKHYKLPLLTFQCIAFYNYYMYLYNYIYSYTVHIFTYMYVICKYTQK